MLRRSTGGPVQLRPDAEHICPVQRVNLDYTSPHAITRQTVEIGLITRRSCLQIPFSMIRLACTRLRRHPSARFIDGAGIASFSRRADGASSGSQRFPEGRGGVSVPFR